MREEYLKVLQKSLEGIELTVEEDRFIKWISGWDLWTVHILAQIIVKCRKTENKKESRD